MEKKEYTRRKCSFVASRFMKSIAVRAQITVSCQMRTYNKSTPYRAPVCTIVVKKRTPEVTANIVSKAYLVKGKTNELMHSLATAVNIVLLLLVVPIADRGMLMQVIV